MALTAGTRLGVYDITAPIGEGGMGQVWRATDTTLGRQVAIKILPDAFASDPERLTRFEREAKTLASLNHPHIAAIYGFEKTSGTHALVMELVEGDDLSQRISRGAIPLDEALPIAQQIAEALEAAHEQGIVHRDLKPANIKARADGTVKVLDFGLAKALDRGSGNGEQGSPHLANSPTITTPAKTRAGMILGTAAYMAPEQAKGKAVDRRADVWAFGAVLYEMLAGQRAFKGEDTTDTIVAVVSKEPDWTALPAATPPPIRRLLRRCLEKDRKRRLDSAADARLEIEEAMAPLAAEVPAPASVAVATSGRSTRVQTAAAAILAAVVILAVGAVGSRVVFTPRGEPAPVMRFDVMPPTGTHWSPSPVASTVQLALSPDGGRIAFVAAPRRGVPRLWIRSLDSTQAQPLTGTDDAAFPFWSADGRSIGFFAGGKLKTIDTTGGAPQVLADAPLGRGGSWNRDGVILFAPAPNRGIWRVAAAGGSLSVVIERSAGEATTNHVWPQFLADGHRFIFYQRSDDTAEQGVFASDLTSRRITPVLRNDGVGVTAPGRIFFVREGSLFGQVLDEDTMRPVGDSQRVADGVGYTLGTIGYSPVAAASTVLAYGPAVKLETVLQWRDRTGTAVGQPVARGVYRSPRLSPDGRQVLLSALEEGATSTDVSILDLVRGTWRAVTRDPTTDWFPVWDAGGDRVYFGAARRRATTVYERDLNGTSGEQVVIPLDVARYPVDATSDGRLVFQTGSSDGYDLGVLDINGDRSPKPMITTPFNEVQGRVSPDHRWIAYASDESGRFEVYVRAFPSGADLSPISPAGGMQPEWRADGRELFYISSDRKLMAAPVTTEGGRFTAGVPRALFDVDLPEPTAPFLGDYAVSADGQRFLLNSLADQPQATPLTIVLNWAAGLRR